MLTLSQKELDDIAVILAPMVLPKGLGTKENACSIAAINLAISGKLSDSIPDCMSPVIGKWIIRVQDAMPADMRNSHEWKYLLPFAAGTGREHEKQRVAIIIDWMWVECLPQIQPLADKSGFGNEWRDMCRLKTPESARLAKRAAAVAAYAYASASASAAANAVAYAYASASASAAADAANAVAYAVAYAAASAYAADAAVAYVAAYDAASAGFWGKADPIQLLRKLIAVSHDAIETN